MKTLLLTMALLTLTAVASKATHNLIIQSVEIKLDIKIKNDSGDEITVIKEGSGGTYRLTKNATTTIKMASGDKLYLYEKGKKGKLLLTATKELEGKVQLFSKL
jgi:hypothetical protein